MKEKPILPLLLSMSLPMVISMMVNSLYNIVDSFFVAQIDEKAMTALSLVFPVQNLVNAAAIGFGIGINAAIAFFLGAGQRQKADMAATQGMLCSLVHGVVMMAVSLLSIRAFLQAFTQDAEVIAYGMQYSVIVFGFSIVISAGLAFEKLFQAVGRMSVAMAAMLAGCLANIVLDPVLIFGIGPVPAMGIRGAALATGIGQILTLAIYLAVYLTRPISVHIRPSLLRGEAGRQTAGEGERESGLTPYSSLAILKRLYAVGLPAALNLALPSLLVSALNAILALYSGTYVLVLGVYYKLQTFLYLPANGIIQGMRPIIGYNYGAGEERRVREIYRTVMVLVALIMAAGTCVCLLIPAQLMGLFTENPETVAAGAQALRIISAGFVVSSVSVTASGALEGLGKGTASFVISALRYAVVIIPAAWLLSRVLGAAGVWWAFGVTELLSAVAAHFVYRRATERRDNNARGVAE